MPDGSFLQLVERRVCQLDGGPVRMRGPGRRDVGYGQMPPLRLARLATEEPRGRRLGHECFALPHASAGCRCEISSFSVLFPG
eukprot:1436633-Amphidinium_carterae.1